MVTGAIHEFKVSILVRKLHSCCRETKNFEQLFKNQNNDGEFRLNFVEILEFLKAISLIFLCETLIIITGKACKICKGKCQ